MPKIIPNAISGTMNFKIALVCALILNALIEPDQRPIIKLPQYIAIKGVSISLDTSNTILSFKYPWKEQTQFRIILPKDAFKDTSGIGLAKSDTLRFATKKETEYGSIRLRFSNLNLGKNPVLQFIQSDKIVESIPLKSLELVRKLYRAGSYDLRILYDTNQNGVWDTGVFGKIKKQPETVQLISKPLVVRGNWDNEVNITW